MRHRPGRARARAIVDKWVEVPAGTEIGFDRAADAKRFTVSDTGIVILPAEYEFIGSGQSAPSSKRL